MNNSISTATIRSWVELYSDNLYSWAIHKTASKETAEDLVQETFLAALKSLEKFKGESSPKTWLFAILNNKINDHYRNSYRKPTINNDAIFEELFDENSQWKLGERPQPWADVSDNLSDNEDFNKTLKDCLNKLPENWFIAVHLKYIQDENSEAICQELGITVTNLWQIIHRSKLQLRKCLELNWFKK